MNPPYERNPCGAGASGMQAGERAFLGSDTTALRRLRGLLPGISLEVRVALDVARDIWFTGGCSEEDGRRLRTAYERLKFAADAVADAEAEAGGRR